jgi:2-amino-4-hydroxy-6-hydroxymethyldihydropteridine diphosphokinase
MHNIYAIALGSNRRHGHQGSPRQVVAAAIAALEAQGLFVHAVSPIIATPALGPAGRSFANAAALIETDAEPLDLLALLKATERAFGRRRGRRWGPRVLDLDIILWSGGRWSDRRLQIPHPQAAKRDFVLKPLATIAPTALIGPDYRTVAHARARLVRAKPVDPTAHPE